MAFSIIVYKTNSKTNKIGKTLTGAKTLTGLWQEQTSILHPQFLITHDNDILVKYNYAYIEKFNRYYFIKDRKPEDGVYDRIFLDVDAAESWKTPILNSYQLINRQKDAFNMDLIDESIPAYQKEKLATDAFPQTPFNTNGATVQYGGLVFTVVTGGPGAPI